MIGRDLVGLAAHGAVGEISAAAGAAQPADFAAAAVDARPGSCAVVAAAVG